MPENHDNDVQQELREIKGDVKALDKSLDDFKKSVSETNGRFGSRIQKLETRDEVRDEQYRNTREKLDDITKDMLDFQRDQKGSIAELRREQKEAMEDLKRGNKEILEIVTPLKHKTEEIHGLKKDIEKLEGEVDVINGKSGETWENIKKQGLGWAIGIILAIVAAALGLSKFL